MWARASWAARSTSPITARIAFSPFATLASLLWSGMSSAGLVGLEHALWWLALGGILLFTPDFPYTKHAHLFMAPFNFLTRPERTSLGEMEKLDFEDERIEQFGASRLEDLSQTQIVDAFACIMCNRWPGCARRPTPLARSFRPRRWRSTSAT
jgi:hypothetical protein